MERVVNFLKEAETYYLATVEGDQQELRPFGTAHVFSRKLYIQTGKVKQMFETDSRKPKGRNLCIKMASGFVQPENFVEDDRREDTMLDNISILQNIPADDGNTEAFI